MTNAGSTSGPLRFAVIGGGITGLAAAHRLCEIAPTCQVTLFEASDRLGGVLHSVRREEFLIELGADNFITNVPWALDLCRRVGIAEQLLQTNETRRRALVVRNGRLHPVPEGFMLMEPRALWPIMTSPLLSLRGKARVLGEYFISARRDNVDESLASFARRRLGREAFERLVQPLAAGIYTADPEKLSLAATMPRFLDMERQHGGLIRAVRQGAQGDPSGRDMPGSGARYSLFVAPRDGMQSLASAVAARLPTDAVRRQTAVTRVQPSGKSWQVWLAGQDQPETFDGVIIAVAAHLAGRLVEGCDAALAAGLAEIPYASSAVAVMAFKQSQFARPLPGFGFVVPDVERRPILAGSFTSVKFTHRAPAGWELVRVFFGGAARPELVDASDDELCALAKTQLCELLSVQGEPAFAQVVRWRRAMPQYHLGHIERVAAIHKRLAAHAGLELAGNAYDGVGVPLCIRSGELAAERLLALQSV